MHGILASLAFVILFPIGSILMRVVPGRLALFAHAGTQVIAVLIYVAAAGLGIHLVSTIRLPFGNGSLVSASNCLILCFFLGPPSRTKN